MRQTTRLQRFLRWYRQCPQAFWAGANLLLAVALLTTVIGVALARGHAPPNNSKRRQAIARSVIHKLSGDYQLVATLPESNGRIGVVVRGIGRHVTGAGWITPPPRHLVINTLYGANGKVIDVHMPY